MLFEKKRIDPVSRNGKIIGHITLDKLADPNTVEVTLLGEKIIPKSFDFAGHPVFTEEQVMTSIMKEELLKREGKVLSLEAEVTYEEAKIGFNKKNFDTTAGIYFNLSDLSSLCKTIDDRKRFIMCHPQQQLNRYVIFGQYLLDEFAQIWSIEAIDGKHLIYNADVETYAAFLDENKEFCKTSKYIIPKSDAICECCCEKITALTLKNDPCISVDGKVYHEVCYKRYRKLNEIDKFTRKFMDLVYQKSDYTFKTIPNGYCNEACCEHIPWFDFHTIDGDIIVGWRKRVISIEWQSNYKAFDMDKLFKNENVTKWQENGKRGIHAWGNEKALEYVKRVLKDVNPNYIKN